MARRVLRGLCLSLSVCLSLCAEPEPILWCGGVTHQTANFRVETREESDFFVISTTESFSEGSEVVRIPVVSGVTAIDNAPMPQNLTPDTRYYYALESGLSGEEKRYGQFRTMPPPNQPKSFSFGFASCAESGSEHPVFSEIARLQREAEGGDHPHLFFLHMGDLFYEDIDEDNIQLFRDGYRKVWSSASQSELWRNKPISEVCRGTLARVTTGRVRHASRSALKTHR